MTITTGPFRQVANKVFGTNWSKTTYHMSEAKAAPFFEKGAASRKTKRHIQTYEGKEPGSPQIRKPTPKLPSHPNNGPSWPFNPNMGNPKWKV